jgi:short-subunit dehydrogenase involved in D-alanine esterification of teichoic acids
VKLEAKVALVIGGASGIGLAIAKRFSDESSFIAGADLPVDGRLAQV